MRASLVLVAGRHRGGPGPARARCRSPARGRPLRRRSAVVGFFVLGLTFAIVGSRVPGQRRRADLPLHRGAHRRHHRAVPVRPPRRPGRRSPRPGWWNPPSQPIAPLLGLRPAAVPGRPAAVAALARGRRGAAGRGGAVDAQPAPAALGLLSPFSQFENPSGIESAAALAESCPTGSAGRWPSSDWCSARRRPPGGCDGRGGEERLQLKLVLSVGAAVALVTTLTMATWWIPPARRAPAPHGCDRGHVFRLPGRRRYRDPSLSPLRRRLRDRPDPRIHRADPAAGRRLRAHGACAGASRSAAARPGPRRGRRWSSRWRSGRCGARCRRRSTAASSGSATRRANASPRSWRTCARGGRSRR